MKTSMSTQRTNVQTNFSSWRCLLFALHTKERFSLEQYIEPSSVICPFSFYLLPILIKHFTKRLQNRQVDSPFVCKSHYSVSAITTLTSFKQDRCLKRFIRSGIMGNRSDLSRVSQRLFTQN